MMYAVPAPNHVLDLDNPFCRTVDMLVWDTRKVLRMLHCVECATRRQVHHTSEENCVAGDMSDLTGQNRKYKM